MRSDFLIHWTGKDIVQGVDKLADLQALRPDQEQALLQRLLNILTQGFRMNSPAEMVYSGTSGIAYHVPMVCLTEIKLSETFEHAKRYGLLGVAVDRKFVLERYGGPVHYVRNHTKERVFGSLKDIGELEETQKSPKLGEAFRYLLSFMKAMSNRDSDDFLFLDEHEWRLVFTGEQVKDGTVYQDPPTKQTRVRLQPLDVKLVVFPNTRTRDIAAQDPAVKKWFEDLKRPPIFLTIEECLHF
jgi:hypothetical protein